MSCKNIKNDPFLCKILFINDLKGASDCFSDTLEIQNFPAETPTNPLTKETLSYSPPARAFGTRFVPLAQKEPSTSGKVSST